jgi:Anti-sigma factor NepR
MIDEAPARRGRLSREDQRRLGEALKRIYQDIVRQGVPSRFTDLLDKFDNPNEKPFSEVPSRNVDHQKGSSS